MKILYAQCGLGNQLFQYAYIKYLERDGRKDIWIDSSAPSMRKHHGFELRTIFPAIGKRGRFLSYAVGRTLHLLSDISKKGFGYSLETEGDDKLWLRGYWQEFKYADSVRNALLDDLVFCEISDTTNKEMAELIRNSDSVSLHIRRGDYLSPGERTVFGDICTTEYYAEAISYIKKNVENPTFFVFSNDMEWAKQNLDLKDAVFVAHNQGEASFRDMQLMSLCKHNIIANSSFSWWGAWLNTNPNKIVVSPAKWFNNYPETFNDSIVPADWVRVGEVLPNVSLVADFEIGDSDRNNIMAQSYFDFELITPSNQAPPRGNHIFKLTPEEIDNFKDKKYLHQKFIAYFRSL